MNLLKISHFPDFIQYFLDCSQRFPDFSLTKFFKLRKCERCGSLNPRLSILAIQFVVFINIEIFLLSRVSIFRNCIPWNSIKIFTDPPPLEFSTVSLLPLEFHQNSYHHLEFSRFYTFHLLESSKFKPLRILLYRLFWPISSVTLLGNNYI